MWVLVYYGLYTIDSLAVWDFSGVWVCCGYALGGLGGLTVVFRLVWGGAI